MELLVKAAEQHTPSNMMPINTNIRRILIDKQSLSTNDDEKDVDEIDGFTISAFNEKPVQRIEQPKCTSVQISGDISENIYQKIPDKLKDFNKSGPKDPAPNPELKKVNKNEFLKIWDNIIKPELNGKEFLNNISDDLVTIRKWLNSNIQGPKNRRNFKLLQMVSTYLKQNSELDFSERSDKIIFSTLKNWDTRDNDELYKFLKDEDKHHSICIECCVSGDDKTLILCDTKNCPYSYCLTKKCSNLSLKDIEDPSRVKKYECKRCRMKKQKPNTPVNVNPKWISDKFGPLIRDLIKQNNEDYNSWGGFFVDPKEQFLDANGDYDRNAYNEYLKVIGEPMYLKEVRGKLSRREYYTIDQLKRDIKKIFDNARLFNDENHFVHKEANKLEKSWEESYNKNIHNEYFLFEEDTSKEARRKEIVENLFKKKSAPKKKSARKKKGVHRLLLGQYVDKCLSNVKNFDNINYKTFRTLIENTNNLEKGILNNKESKDFIKSKVIKYVEKKKDEEKKKLEKIVKNTVFEKGDRVYYKDLDIIGTIVEPNKEPNGIVQIEYFINPKTPTMNTRNKYPMLVSQNLLSPITKSHFNRIKERIFGSVKVSESPLNKRKPETVLKEASPKKRNLGDRIKNMWKKKKQESVSEKKSFMSSGMTLTQVKEYPNIKVTTITELDKKKKPAEVSTNKACSPKIDKISSESSTITKPSESSTKPIEVIDLTDDSMEETNIRSLSELRTSRRQRILIDKQSLSTNENKVIKKEQKVNELYHEHFKTQLSERIKERLVLDCMIRHVGFLTRRHKQTMDFGIIRKVKVQIDQYYKMLESILKIEVLNDLKKGVEKINQFTMVFIPHCDIRFTNDNIAIENKVLESVIKSIFTSISIWRRKIEVVVLLDLLIEKRNEYDKDDLKYPKGNLKPKSCDFVCNKKIVFKRQEIEVKDYINIYYNKYNRYECSKCNQILDYPISDNGKNTNTCEKCIAIEESRNASSKKYIPGRGKIQTPKRNMTYHF